MFKRLFQRKADKPEFPLPMPDETFIVLGDIHGRADLLQRFLDMGPSYPVVCVGDYIDRGDNSAEVLQILRSQLNVTCISGNHEEMLLDFLENPERSGSRWLRYGGLQTLASFGVAGVTESSGTDAIVKAAEHLRDAMGDDLITWMRTLPTRWQSGNVAIVHAGADPVMAIEDQTTRSLHWGHPDFEKKQRDDGVWVVHGHTIVDAAHATNGRIAIDTGAYATGVLTAALIDENGVQFQAIT